MPFAVVFSFSSRRSPPRVASGHHFIVWAQSPINNLSPSQKSRSSLDSLPSPAFFSQDHQRHILRVVRLPLPSLGLALARRRRVNRISLIKSKTIPILLASAVHLSLSPAPRPPRSRAIVACECCFFPLASRCPQHKWLKNADRSLLTTGAVADPHLPEMTVLGRRNTGWPAPHMPTCMSITVAVPSG